MKLRNGLMHSLAVALMATSTSFGLTFSNGSFEGLSAGISRNSFNSAVPPGWAITGGTPDTFNAATTFAGFTWAASHDGGDFLHGIGLQPGYSESAKQDALTGLVIGQVYEISFEQSISSSSFATPGAQGFWRVQFGSEIQDSVIMTTPVAGTASTWNYYTMFFTATATSQNLLVTAFNALSNNDRVDIGIDGFYLGDVRPNPPGENLDPRNAPDHGSTLLLLSLALLGLIKMRKHSLGSK